MKVCYGEFFSIQKKGTERKNCILFNIDTLNRWFVQSLHKVLSNISLDKQAGYLIHPNKIIHIKLHSDTKNKSTVVQMLFLCF